MHRLGVGEGTSKDTPLGSRNGQPGSTHSLSQLLLPQPCEVRPCVCSPNSSVLTNRLRKK